MSPQENVQFVLYGLGVLWILWSLFGKVTR